MCSSQTPPQTHWPASIIIYHLVSSYFITKRQKKRATDSTCSGFRDKAERSLTLLLTCLKAALTEWLLLSASLAAAQMK